MIKITPKQFQDDCKLLANRIKKNKYKKIYGIPRGDTLVAVEVNKYLSLELTDSPDSETLIVDDLIDSGRTLAAYSQDKAVLYKKGKHQIIFVKEFNEWIEFFYEETKKDAEDLVVRMLECIGENPNREGLLETPSRVVKSWKELYIGYECKVDVRDFSAPTYTGMVLLKDIELYSMCEHHILPFIGKCHIAYIPNKRVIGISKLARIMEMYCRRLQIQEQLTDQIADYIKENLKPKGVAVSIEAEHLCMRMRGINKQNSTKNFKSHPMRGGLILM